MKNKVVGYAFDNWVLSGISQFASGMPAAISFTTTNSENLNGGGDAQRVNVVGNAFSGTYTLCSLSGSTRRRLRCPG